MRKFSVSFDEDAWKLAIKQATMVDRQIVSADSEVVKALLKTVKIRVAAIEKETPPVSAPRVTTRISTFVVRLAATRVAATRLALRESQKHEVGADQLAHLIPIVPGRTLRKNLRKLIEHGADEVSELKEKGRLLEAAALEDELRIEFVWAIMRGPFSWMLRRLAGVFKSTN